MADMAMLDYAMMVEDSHVDSRLASYRLREPTAARAGWSACCLTDVLDDGLSMVYSFYEPGLPRVRSAPT